MLHVHRAGRADLLVGALADVLAVPPDDPMMRDTVAVHSRGIERWLAQELSLRLGVTPGRADGVCANIEFVFRREVVDDPLALAQPASGSASTGDRDADPWASSRLVWRLLDLLETRSPELDIGPLALHLDDRAARYGAAWRVADLFDRYAVHRPGMLLAWLDGRRTDAVGEPLSDAHRWQADVWIALRDRVGHPSRPERQAVAVERLREGSLDLDLPPRVSLFNLTALAASHLELLRAIAVHRDVHLFLLHASPALWDRLAPAASGAGLPLRDDDPSSGIAQHPLLASWGRDTRELQLVLAAEGATSSALHDPGDLGVGVGVRADVPLLQRLHADIRADRRPPGAPIGEQQERRALLSVGDRSVQIHSCHGRTRQVEVLRDAIGHLLAADPQLQPRDIVVLCPDVEQFAPLVHAVFGAEAVTAERDDGELPQLRVRIADRSLRESNPLMEVVAGALDLVDSRVEASRVLDLAGRQPVRRRFRLDDDDLARLETWTDDVGVRWGFDGEHRAVHDLDGVGANTWRAGLDRLLVGVAVPDQDLRMFGGVVPHDVEGDDVDRAGRLAELIARLRVTADELGRAQPIADWCGAIRRAVDRLAVVPDRDSWQRQQLEHELDAVLRDATDLDGATASTSLELAEVRTLLGDRLRGRPSRANHRTGDLTVCTLVPMRSVPHRVVCLLGMDDTAFPRTTQIDGDSLIDAAPRVGDRDPRTEDRQLLLDAVLAATDALVVTYTGRNERTNEPEPPAVPIGELLDAIDATVVPAAPGVARARDAVVVEHPLQGFDPRNFEADRLGVPGVWGFERTDLAGARALRSPRGPIGRFVPEPLPQVDEPIVGLDDLTAFLTHPVRAFLSRRLGVRVPRDQDERDDAIPVEAAPLVRYAIGQRRLEAALRGADPVRWEAVERGRGELPPGHLADPVLAEVNETVAALVAAGAGLGALTDASGPVGGIPVEIDLALAGGRSLVGAVRGVHGDVTGALRYANLGPRHHLEAYVQLVALTAAQPDRRWTAVAVGRNPKKAKAKAAWCRLGPLGESRDERQEAATRALELLLDLYDHGLTEPLPLYCKTSAAYADAVSGSRPNRYKAATTWDDEWGFPENADPEHVVVLGPSATYESLLLDAPSDRECGPGWADVASRFEALALRLWQPIAACREEGTA